MYANFHYMHLRILSIIHIQWSLTSGELGRWLEYSTFQFKIDEDYNRQWMKFSSLISEELRIAIKRREQDFSVLGWRAWDG